MPKALSIDRAVDSNLKPVKDSDGTITALELSTDNVRVKNLEVLGDIRIGGDSTLSDDTNIAGQILGYTVIGLDATPATFDVTNAMLPVHDDLKVSFTFPPSGKVEIMASIYRPIVCQHLGQR